ncbi:hypothetical protein [Rhizobium sp. G21]|uniref:hypothetical protein n=1 Tax=Rhizobium sp. G21 TaxID=2758439 RepID=UPI0016033F53|nr:hypothetical protein [Rhizobium sp. G21]MBB1249611.1 hypothetical protein [Rhizobium sp. G21]
MDTPTTIVYVKPDGSAAPAGSYPPADDAVSFTLYADGSLESYRSLGSDGSFTWLKFAQAEPGSAKPFGPNSEYSHGDLVFSETLDRGVVDGVSVLVHKVQSFQDGNLTDYEFSYGSPENSAVVVEGNYDPATGQSTVTLTSLDQPAPITNSGTGFINGLNGLTPNSYSATAAP